MSLYLKTKFNTAEDSVVDVADIWGEGYYSYLGRPDTIISMSEVSRDHIQVALNITECHLKG